MLFNSIPYLSPAHPSWRCTASDMAHCYCLVFGARVDSSHHVWGMSKVGEGKDRCCSTETSQNHCVGVWWAEHVHDTGFPPFAISLLYRVVEGFSEVDQLHLVTTILIFQLSVHRYTKHTNYIWYDNYDTIVSMWPSCSLWFFYWLYWYLCKYVFSV